MRPTDSSPLRWRRAGLAFGIWTLLGLFDASETYFKYSTTSWGMTWPRAIALGLFLWYAWALLSIPVFELVRRYPIGRRHTLSHVGLHLAAGVVVALVKLVMDYPVIEAFFCPDPGLRPFWDFYQMGLKSHFHKYVLIYWAMVGVAHALSYYGQFRDRARKAALLEERLAQAQLQVLKMQLQPHFLFNTLNAISALIHTDVEVADRMLARLGDLLRLTLENGDGEEVPLRQELEFLQAYLEIEQARFGPRLEVRLEIEPEVLNARVPYLILQPLVENSIRHGLGPQARSGSIAVRAEQAGGRLLLQVRDDGRGLQPAAGGRVREGIGLSNTRSRLRQLYGDEYRFEIRNGPDGGAVVSIELPLNKDPGGALNNLDAGEEERPPLAGVGS